MCHGYIVYKPLPNLIEKKKTFFNTNLPPSSSPDSLPHFTLANGPSSCHLLLTFTGQGQTGHWRASRGECADDLGFPVVYTWPRVVVMEILLLTLVFWQYRINTACFFSFLLAYHRQLTMSAIHVDYDTFPAGMCIQKHAAITVTWQQTPPSALTACGVSGRRSNL